VFEVEANSVGQPIDLVPQTVERREIRVARYDLYISVMEEVFGSSEIVMLTDQFRPFFLREVWTGPGIEIPGVVQGLLPDDAQRNLNLDSTARGFLSAASSVVSRNKSRQYEYVGCWFSDIGRNIDAKSDRTISVDATIQYLDRRRLR